MGTVILISILLLSIFLYKRYMPVYGVMKMNENEGDCKSDNVVIVDTRDYQTSTRDHIEQAYLVPIAYINRHYGDIPDKNVIIISSDVSGKNLSARMLRKKGMRVIGYKLVNEKERGIMN